MKNSSLISIIKKLAISSLFATSILAASDIEVKDAYVRATPPGLPNSAAFLTIENNTDKTISINSALSNISDNVELHTHDMKNGVMKMYQVPKIDVPAHGKTVLKPGGYHVMLIGLKKQLKVGEQVDFTLLLSNDEMIKVVAPVKTVMSGMKMNHNMNHKMMDHSKMNH